MRFVRGIEDSFRDVYLTLVSIIQGVAVGYLAQIIAEDYQRMTATQWVQMPGSTAIIVVI